ncbi:Manganese lipoxygenase [Paramyrothecium foliicola]|nr:Manganese lipoxygenase [Paramyrothecium foliicola]
MYITMHVLHVLLSVLAIAAAAPSTKYTLPQHDAEEEQTLRRQEIEQKQADILYGPSLIGETSFYPAGPVGKQISVRDQLQWRNDSAFVQQAAAKEAVAVAKAIQDHGGLRTLEDFAVLYNEQWKGTVPDGIADGILGNFTSDLLFAMERLSVNPYILKRLHPTDDEVPFDVDAQVTEKLTGTTVAALHKKGRLFVADHSYQKEYVAQPGRFAAACSALFYLDKRSDQLLPIAIKTNVGSDLTYTPIDEPNDWLLAKIMFNVNDLFHSQIYHLANSHAVAEIVHLAALRTLSARHPVFALLDRIMYQAYAIRPIGEAILFNPGGLFDQNFAFSSEWARVFAADFYPTVAGPFKANYFESNLRLRGLIDAKYGPALPDFPFHEDGSKIVETIREFFTTFIKSIYKSDKDVLRDTELQAWLAEANGPAEVIDFPHEFQNRKELIDVLTHMAWLTGVSHHVLNQGEPVTTSGVLPFHPASLYAPIPTKKGGIESLLPWLPNEQKSIEQVSLLARFNRPQVTEKKETTQYMFNSDTLLAGTSPRVSDANSKYIKDMERIGQQIENRRFDKHGLSQGMPFIWTGMNPSKIPFFLSV